MNNWKIGDTERRKWPCGHCGDHVDHKRDIQEISDWMENHKVFSSDAQGALNVAIEKRVTIGQFKWTMAGIGGLLMVLLIQLFIINKDVSEVKTDVKVAIATNTKTVELLQSQINHIGGIQQSVISHLPVKDIRREIP